LQYLIPADLTWIYIAAVVITGVLFVTPFKLKKLGLKGILVLVGIGAAEFIALIIAFVLRHR